MQDQLVTLDKLKEIFSYSTGERTIEVTSEEYSTLLNEALERGLEIVKEEDWFSLNMGELSLKIICDDEEEGEDF